MSLTAESDLSKQLGISRQLLVDARKTLKKNQHGTEGGKIVLTPTGVNQIVKTLGLDLPVSIPSSEPSTDNATSHLLTVVHSGPPHNKNSRSVSAFSKQTGTVRIAVNDSSLFRPGMILECQRISESLFAFRGNPKTQRR